MALKGERRTLSKSKGGEGKSQKKERSTLFGAGASEAEAAPLARPVGPQFESEKEKREVCGKGSGRNRVTRRKKKDDFDSDF